MNPLIRILSFIDKVFAVTIRGLLVVILFVMISLGAVQVLLRDLFGGGLTWSDTAARNMVLWVAFLGAILATRRRQHIAIDVITRFIPSAPRNVVLIFVDTFSCIVTYLLAHAAYLFVVQERLFGGIAFANVPVWVVESIIPIGFALISIEYAIGILLDIWHLFHPRTQEIEGGQRS